MSVCLGCLYHKMFEHLRFKHRHFSSTNNTNCFYILNACVIIWNVRCIFILTSLCRIVNLSYGIFSLTLTGPSAFVSLYYEKHSVTYFLINIPFESITNIFYVSNWTFLIFCQEKNSLTSLCRIVYLSFGIFSLIPTRLSAFIPLYYKKKHSYTLCHTLSFWINY